MLLEFPNPCDASDIKQKSSGAVVFAQYELS